MGGFLRAAGGGWGAGVGCVLAWDLPSSKEELLALERCAAATGAGALRSKSE
jgi:hypothetical protein